MGNSGGKCESGGKFRRKVWVRKKFTQKCHFWPHHLSFISTHTENHLSAQVNNLFYIRTCQPWVFSQEANLTYSKSHRVERHNSKMDVGPCSLGSFQRIESQIQKESLTRLAEVSSKDPRSVACILESDEFKTFLSFYWEFKFPEWSYDSISIYLLPKIGRGNSLNFLWGGPKVVSNGPWRKILGSKQGRYWHHTVCTQTSNYLKGYKCETNSTNYCAQTLKLITGGFPWNLLWKPWERTDPQAEMYLCL